MINSKSNSSLDTKDHSRIEIIDSLRGFALLGIMLIHGVEQFNFFYKTEYHFLFSEEVDRAVIKTVFFMISQKAFSIFALMFGISFFIQMNNQESKGVDYRKRFAWRLLILFGMGIIHSMFYNGDILAKYALLGFLLLFIYRFDTKVLWLLVILLALQIPFIIQLISSFVEPNYIYIPLKPAFTDIKPGDVYANSGFWDVLKFNIWKGSSRSWTWTYNTGRFYQLMALFIMGLILGRKNFFRRIHEYTKLAFKIFVICLVLGVALQIVISKLSGLDFTRQQLQLSKTILSSYYNMFFTIALIALFVLKYRYLKVKAFKILAVYGRMSLTNYLAQTLFGTFFFYGYGLGMYKYMGYTWGLVYGVVFFALQIFFCNWWLNRYRYGPVEWLWRALTKNDFKLRNH